MKPAASIILFTTIAGAAQGLAVVLGAAALAQAAPRHIGGMLWGTVAMLVIALAASFFHLGHPRRAWRAALMWRTSWMSREVIVLPAFIGLTALWALTGGAPSAARWLPWLVIACAFLLWYCTAMIYACIRFIQEWAHPLTLVNYVLLGLSSGAILCGALAVAGDDAAFAGRVGPWALGLTGLAWATRYLALRRNATLVPKSNTQSATGIRSARVVQKSMGMTGGSFNTREFFHGARPQVFRAARSAFPVLAFLAPILLVAAALAGGWRFAWLVAAPVQALGLLVERWFFFAQARHPQNIYYQTVS